MLGASGGSLRGSAMALVESQLPGPGHMQAFSPYWLGHVLRL
jgi:hypothetical protein